ncbi:MAG: FHA domain-containing protein [Polyangiaceae bacterium]|nr:FHA domain-containing protein [Polyangiaceae bacterium]
MDTGSTESMIAEEGTELGLVLIQQLGGAPEDDARRVLVTDGLLLGRDNPAFVARYPALSRRHAELKIEGERARVVDLKSRHGTFIGGRRVEQALLAPGELLELGGAGFVLTRAPARFVPARHPRFAYASFAFAAALESVHAARLSRRPVLLVGEHGVGKTALAEELAAPEAASSQRALLVDRLDEATQGAQRALLTALREAEHNPQAPRVIVTSCEPPEALVASERLLPQLASYLSAWVIQVPPLAARPEDILPIVRRHLTALDPSGPWTLHPRLARRLVMSPWPGNVRALLAEVERLQLGSRDRQLNERLEAEPQSASSALRVGVDGSWIEDAMGNRTDISGRRVLRSVLRALVEAQLSGEELLTPSAVAERTWPGERMLPRAALNRVYVAVTSLRKLGLGRAIEHVNGGYRFAEGAVEIVS